MKKRKTIGKMAGSRMTWQINPVTRVKRDRTKYTRKVKHKNKDRGDWYVNNIENSTNTSLSLSCVI